MNVRFLQWLLFTVLFGGPMGTLCAEAPALGAILATGEGVEVRRGQLDEAWAIYAARMSRGGQLPDEPREAVEARLLNHIINTQILMRRATDEEKDAARAETDKTVAEARQRFGSDDDFEAWAKSTGMTAAAYRQRQIEQRACERVIDREVGPSASISDERLKQYYDENAQVFDRPEQLRGRQIFFATTDPTTKTPLSDDRKKEKENLAGQVKARLDKGEDFFALYQEFSEEPWAKKEVDGDEMLYTRGQMPPEFDATAFALKLNEVSGVVATTLGYHIIRVTKHQPAGRSPLSEVGPRLKNFLIQEEIRKLMPAYLEKLRREAGVKILLLDCRPS